MSQADNTIDVSTHQRRLRLDLLQLNNALASAFAQSVGRCDGLALPIRPECCCVSVGSEDGVLCMRYELQVSVELGAGKKEISVYGLRLDVRHIETETITEN